MADLSNLSDGTYGRELGRISPEGNMYGATRWVHDVFSNFWWNGAEWLEIGWDIGQSASVSLLPTTTARPRYCLEMFRPCRKWHIYLEVFLLGCRHRWMVTY